MKVSISADGTVVQYGGQFPTNQVHLLAYNGSVYNSAVGRTTLLVEGGRLQSMDVSEDGSVVAHASQSVVRVGDIRDNNNNNNKLVLFRPNVNVLLDPTALIPGIQVDIALSADGSRLIVAWTAPNRPVQVRAFQWIKDGNDDGAGVWTNRGLETLSLYRDRVATRVAVSLSGSRLAVAAGGILRLYDLPM
eukprot:CAMPEP_0116557546 /NCGR_PEP_ID=MMETSP0397-20121206/9301_1 /TAXON_ID=216820 /ORGANISM="Cyclophora tenuis, Strain ECT3854" /LENGTH=190 /DNA_ID=CAMNT_0004083017 /DNA_START=45 /DNA_END=617 /DNA_ORIENTATION=+